MSTTRRIGAAAALAATTIVCVPTDALARHSDPDLVIASTALDRDDTRGRLDVAAVGHRIAVHQRRHVRIAYRLRMHQRFRTTDLHRHRRSITLELGKDPGSGASHNVTIYARSGRLSADLISNATRKRIAKVRVRRTGPRTIRIRGPRRLIGARRFFVHTRYEKPSTAPCGRVGGVLITCGDSVPDAGWLRPDRRAWPRTPPG